MQTSKVVVTLLGSAAVLAGLALSYEAWRESDGRGTPAGEPGHGAPVSKALDTRRAALPAVQHERFSEKPSSPSRRAMPEGSGLPASDSSRRERADRIREHLRRAPSPRPEGRASTPAATQGAAHSTGGTEPGSAAQMPAPEGEGNQAQRPLGAYIQSTVKELFVPLAGSCYEQLLARDPEAKGTVVLELEIVGDTAVGGVVESVELGEGTTIRDEELQTCVSESLYATVFDAPPEGERSVTVTYPITFGP